MTSVWSISEVNVTVDPIGIFSLERSPRLSLPSDESNSINENHVFLSNRETIYILDIKKALADDFDVLPTADTMADVSSASEVNVQMASSGHISQRQIQQQVLFSL